MLSEKKIYTLEEANALVPKLLSDVPVIQNLNRLLIEDFPDVENARQNAKLNGGSMQGGAYLGVAMRFSAMCQDLQSKGCILKGIEQGLVDFYSIRDGREVFLCWKHPEKEIKHWHDIDTGFSGRQAI
jgi:hypothetical protein